MSAPAPFGTAIALANVAGQAGAVVVVLRDENGASIAQGKISLDARGHGALMLDSEFPQTAGRRGTIELRRPADGWVSVLGLRAGPAFSLASVPSIAK